MSASFTETHTCIFVRSFAIRKMLDALNLEYNRLRQSAITTELLDLSSGRFFSDTNTR